MPCGTECYDKLNIWPICVQTGPLCDPVKSYGINFVGTQIQPQWDFQNKGTLTSPARLFFVFKVRLHFCVPESSGGSRGGAREFPLPLILGKKKKYQKGEKPAGQVNQNRPPPSLNSRSGSATGTGRLVRIADQNGSKFERFQTL